MANRKRVFTITEKEWFENAPETIKKFKSQETLNELIRQAKIAKLEPERRKNIENFENLYSLIMQWTLSLRFIASGMTAGLSGQLLGLGNCLPTIISEMVDLNFLVFTAISSVCGATMFMATTALVSLYVRKIRDTYNFTDEENELAEQIKLSCKWALIFIGKGASTFFIFSLMSAYMTLAYTNTDDSAETQQEIATVFAELFGNIFVAGAMTLYFTAYSKLFNLPVSHAFKIQVFIALFAMPYGDQLATWLINEQGITEELLKEFMNGSIPALTGVAATVVPVVTTAHHICNNNNSLIADYIVEVGGFKETDIKDIIVEDIIVVETGSRKLDTSSSCVSSTFTTVCNWGARAWSATCGMFSSSSTSEDYDCDEEAEVILPRSHPKSSCCTIS